MKTKEEIEELRNIVKNLLIGDQGNNVAVISKILLDYILEEKNESWERK